LKFFPQIFGNKTLEKLRRHRPHDDFKLVAMFLRKNSAPSRERS